MNAWTAYQNSNYTYKGLQNHTKDVSPTATKPYLCKVPL